MKFFELENLSQGARIAFARQFRGLTQELWQDMKEVIETQKKIDF